MTEANRTPWDERPWFAFEEISVSFGAVRAVIDVSVAVKRGEICALIGPNGAGKSTLLNVISGVYRPGHGAIVFEGRRHREMRPRTAARLGMARTFQNIALFRGMSARDNILTGRNLHIRSGFLQQAFASPQARRDEANQRDKAEQVLEFLDLQAHRDTPVGKLPYGLQKRVELGRALAAEPKLLLLDEPMAGMTAGEKYEMSRFIVDVNTALGITVILIEHDMGVVMDLSDHVVVLDHGRKIGDGTPTEVRGSQAVIDAYLGIAHDTDAAA